MSTKRPAAAAAAANPLAAVGAASDIPRQQLALAAESACALFRGFEAIRKIQEQTAHRALARHSAAVEKLKRPCQPADLMAIQSELLRFDLEGATQYWQHLGAAALEMQTEMLSCCSQLMDSETIRNAAAAVEAFPAMAGDFNGFLRAGARPEAP